MNRQETLSPIEEIIDEARNGRMFVLVDDEGRENEGDLVIAAQMATPEAINFMAKNGRGLVCLALTSDRVDGLELPLMPQHNASRHRTAFTVSIEAREGVSTGISAGDRAHTIAVATDPAKGKDDLVMPGHIFPLAARDGGVLVRAGHTEAAVDIARLAGLNASGVVCEIMNDDGTMARMPDLVAFARRHELKLGAIADIIAYRLSHDPIVEPLVTSTLDSAYGGTFQMVVYINKVAYAEHVALVKGDITTDEPVLVRMHAFGMLEDVLGNRASGKAHELHTAMRMIGERGRGVVVVIREPRPTSLSDGVRSSAGNGKPNGPAGSELRDYGVGAQILLDLGVRDMILLSNTKRTIIGLQGYGLSVVEQRPIPPGEQ